MKEKQEIVQKWKKDSKKHQEFYDYITKKVKDSEKQSKEYKLQCEQLKVENEDLQQKVEYFKIMGDSGAQGNET